MVRPQKARLLVRWGSSEPETIELQYNPTELSFDKGVQFGEINIPGLSAPLQQFVRGRAETLTLELFFDTTDAGMGRNATSVTTLTDKIFQLAQIESHSHAPPICTFLWNEAFPGSSLGSGANGGQGTSPAGSVPAPPDGEAAPPEGEESGETPSTPGTPGAAEVPLGSQRRTSFTGVVESVRQRFTLFSPEGVPLRATVTVAMREYQTLGEQLRRLNLTSPDRTHAHVLQQQETLSAVAGRYYGKPAAWRAIADENDLEDPRRLQPGTPLTVPSLRS